MTLRKIRRTLAPTLAILVLAAPGAALELQSPLDCALGSECFVLQHVDRDRGPGAQDYLCNPLTYDGHKGVDFALPSLAAMQGGVDVVAAADGLVLATRDGMQDIDPSESSQPSVKGRECGNGVLIAHEDRMVTQYCHMKIGTIAVTKDSRVSAGQRLGSVGLSGNTQFPHLHFTVRQGDEVIDPFDGGPMGSPCDPSASGAGLWAPDSDVSYAPGGALIAGIVDYVPTYSDVNAVAPDAGTLAKSAPAIVHWAHFFGLREGDVIETRLMGPGGELLATDRHAMPGNRIRQFRAIGRRKPETDWPTGVYEGVSRLLRQGEIVDEIRTAVQVP